MTNLNKRADEVLLQIFNDVVRTVELRKVDSSGGVFPIYGKEVNDRAKAALLNDVLEIVGEDEKLDLTKADYYTAPRNQLRAEIRSKLNAYFGGSGE